METVQPGVPRAPSHTTAASNSQTWVFRIPDRGRARTLLFVATFAAVALEFALQFIASHASRFLMPSGIPLPTLQLTSSTDSLYLYLNKWDHGPLMLCLRLNFVFIITYGFVLMSLLQRATKARMPGLRVLAKILLIFAFAGLVCDLTENFLMLWFACHKDAIQSLPGAVETGRVLSILKFFTAIPACIFIALFCAPCKAIQSYIATTLKIIWTVRFPFFVVLLLIGLLCFLQQGAEIIRVSVHGDIPIDEVATAAAHAAGKPQYLPPYPFKLLFIGDMLAVIVVAIGAWYFARLLLDHASGLTSDYNERKAPLRKTPYQTHLMRQLPRLIGSGLCLGVGIAAFRAKTVSNYRSINDLLLGVFYAQTGIAIALYLGFIYRRKWLAGREKPAPDPNHPFYLVRGESIPVLIAFTIWFVLLILFIFWPVPIGRKLTPLVVILLGFGSWIPIGSFLAYVGTKKRIPFMTVLVLAAGAFTFFDLNDNHAMRRLGNHENVTNSVSQYFTKWSSTRPASSDHRYPVFLIATEGGGVRAAADTAIVLGGLQDSNALFFEHVFAISSVSGGSVGATVFSALCKNWHTNGATQDDPNGQTYSALATNLFTQDYLSPLVGMGLFPDLLQRFIFPAIPCFDRVRGLETAFERSVTNRSESLLTQSYFKWHENITDGPALLLNSTDVKSGRRMTVAPFNFGHDNDDRPLLLCDVADNFDLSLSTAMCISARFPIFTPAGHTIHTSNSEPPQNGEQTKSPEQPKAQEQTKYRFVDGGIYENSGTATLLDVLSLLYTNTNYQFFVIRIGGKLGSSVDTNTPAIATAVTDVTAPVATNTTTNKHHKLAQALPKYGNDGFDELAPIFAVLNTREARGDDVTHELADALAICKCTNMIEFTWTNGTVQLPLGWYIGSGACWNLHQQFTSHKQEIAQVTGLLNKWHTATTTPPPLARK